MDVLFFLKENSIGLSGFGVVLVGVPVGGTLVEGLADDFEGVGTIGVEDLAVWCDVAVWRDVAAWNDDDLCEIVEDTKIKAAILKTF